MIVRFLGTAAGGGVPQWNCGCPGCVDARRRGHHRTQDTLAVSGDERSWYLVNASADLRAQVLAAPNLAPRPGTRDTPIRGVLLTTAELDHTLGLVTLREASRLDVYASPTVLAGVEPLRRLLDAYTEVRWIAVTDGEAVELAGGLTVRRTTIGSKRPRYAADVAGGEWVSALDIVDSQGGGRLVYATCVAEWSGPLDRLVEGADRVVLDGTFHTDDELARVTGRDVSGRTMGHLPIVDSISRVDPQRVLYSHVNNTNPLPAEVPYATDGLTITL